MAVDHVSLSVPADTRYTPLVRLAATQLAAQSGFDVDRIEDVRVAVNEATRILSDDGSPPLATDFEIADGGFSARLTRVLTVRDRSLEGRSERILGAVTTGFGVDLGPGSPASVVIDFAGETGATDRQDTDGSNRRGR